MGREKRRISPAISGVDPARRRRLLRSVEDEGGFAFVKSEAKAAAGDPAAAEAAMEMAWEQLHSGPWHAVVTAWRDAYAMACLHVARNREAAGETAEAIKALDMGLIMGGTLLRKDLEESIARVRTSGGGVEKREVNGITEGGVGNWEFSCLDLEEGHQTLPVRSLSAETVEKQISPSMEKFLCNFFLRGSPVILINCIDHWPACSKWKDINYLMQIAGDRTVPVEVGRNYLTPEWKQELIAFSELLKRIQSKGCPENRTYLAQHPLFDQIQELRDDIMVPDYCFTGGGVLQSVNAWFGPAGTVTPLHQDPHHNLLAQVVGKKYIRLYPPSASKELCPYDETMLSNSSQVDLDDLDVKKFPGVRDLKFMDCILSEGEMLYIPPKWWHYVRSLTPSFSVSFWWSAK